MLRKQKFYSSRKKINYSILPPCVDIAKDDNEPLNGDSIVKSNGSSIKFIAFLLLFIIGIFIKLPPNKAAGLVGLIIGIVAFEFNDVKES